MGSLAEKKTGQLVPLESETLVGRSDRSSLRLADSLVSMIHASILWTPEGWEVRDLGSRNGTFLNGARLEAGQDRKLCHWDTLAFGSLDSVWELVDDGGPQAVVFAVDGDAFACAHDELIVVPSESEPAVTVFRDAEGRWSLESSEQAARRIQSGERFEAVGRQWRFSCPRLLERTVANRDGDVRTALLSFAVSSDEEHVAITAEHQGAKLDLGVRAHNQVLLLLARRRLEDTAAGIPAASSGWMYVEELAKALGHVPPEHVNVAIFRIRKHLIRFFGNAAEIIERRSGTRQLRIAVAQLHVMKA